MRIIRPITVHPQDLTSNVPVDEPVWNSATTYAANAVVRGTGIWENTLFFSLQDGNQNKTPGAAGSAAWWLKYIPTNRWRMFDQAVGTLTSQPEEINVTIHVDEMINSLVALEINAAEMEITITSPTEGLVYHNVISLISTEGITNWWRYYFEPIRRKRDVAVLDIPPVSDVDINVVLRDPGAAPSIGSLIIGPQIKVGMTQYGMGLGGTDFSVKSRDDWGVVTLVRRSFARLLTASVWVERGMVDQAYRILEENRATPIVYIGAEEYGASLVYGWWREFNFSVDYKNYSNFTAVIEGLV